jgi:hypothetical protein
MKSSDSHAIQIFKTKVLQKDTGGYYFYTHPEEYRNDTDAEDYKNCKNNRP